MHSTSRFQTIQDCLAAGNLKQALALLNSGVPHRFSGVYVLRDGVFHNIALIDKLGEWVPAHLKAVPLEHSFCQFVMRDHGVDIPDSSADARLDGHPYQGVMVSYTGVPITDAQREIVGTVCHFDTVKHQLSADEYQLLWNIAPSIDVQLLAEMETRH